MVFTSSGRFSSYLGVITTLFGNSTSFIVHFGHVTFYVAHLYLVFVSFTFGRQPSGDYVIDVILSRYIVQWSVQLLTIFLLPLTTLNAIGYLLTNGYEPHSQHHETRSQHPNAIGQKLQQPKIIIRIPTTGNNRALIEQNVSWHKRILKELCVQNYEIQIITEKTLNLNASKCVQEILVPASYRTPNGSLYKIRNLIYASDEQPQSGQSNQDPCNIWIIHIDEEGRINKLALQSILNLAMEGRYRASPLAISYGHDPSTTSLATFIDSIRVAFDFGHIYATLFLYQGLVYFKGGAMVIRKDLETEVGFDRGPKLSLNEDIFLARRLFDLGEPVAFMKGFVLEQTPASVPALIHQRSRWIRGMLYELAYGGHNRKSQIVLLYFYLSCLSTAWLMFPVLCSLVYQISPACGWLPLDLAVAFVAGTGYFGYSYGALLNFKFSNCWQKPVVLFFCLTSLPQALALVVEGVSALRGTLCFLSEVIRGAPPEYVVTKKQLYFCK